MAVVKIGVIGLGFMGRMHLSAYLKLPNAKVVAVADIDQDKREGKAVRGQSGRRRLDVRR